MRALIVDRGAPGGVRLGEAADPKPSSNEVLVEVEAISLNRGMVGRVAGAADGEILGWDAAGVVKEPSPDGAGPPPGSRVVAFGWGGAWARLRAVGVGELTVVPDGVDLGEASTLPVAGVTALRALRRLGSLLGRRIVVTGASGGVGRFAVQLAARAGAHVIAQASGPDRSAGLEDLGAAEVVSDVAAIERPVHGALDMVGGSTLAHLFDLLGEGGAVESIGAASGEATVFAPYQTVGQPYRRLEAFEMGLGLAADLSYLVGLLAEGALDAQVGWRGSWARAAEAFDALLGRQVRGKVVLDLA